MFTEKQKNIDCSCGHDSTRETEIAREGNTGREDVRDKENERCREQGRERMREKEK